MKPEKWLTLKTAQNPKLRLIIMYHAGGYAQQYRLWQTLLPKEVEALVYERPGRGGRLSEAPCDDWQQLLADLEQDIETHINIPYFLFGHSLGASIAFELAHYLQAKKLPPPNKLIIADRQSPETRDPPIYQLPTNEFIEKLMTEHQLSQEVAANTDLMNFFLPTLRADFKLSDTYMAKTNRPPLNCPLTVYRASKNKEPLADYTRWEKETQASFLIDTIEGEHFFVFDQAEILLGKIFSSY